MLSVYGVMSMPSKSEGKAAVNWLPNDDPATLFPSNTHSRLASRRNTRKSKSTRDGRRVGTTFDWTSYGARSKPFRSARCPSACTQSRGAWRGWGSRSRACSRCRGSPTGSPCGRHWRGSRCTQTPGKCCRRPERSSDGMAGGASLICKRPSIIGICCANQTCVLTSGPIGVSINNKRLSPPSARPMTWAAVYADQSWQAVGRNFLWPRRGRT